ncbi:hypothetical protein [Rubricoccus marinus]|uniref:Helicase HerA barrel domain-containing protein n=1 Tax=Rubricoccus marinus TaxID=716817 RepID=A0A259TZK1_9BACT|nr:hypothetical protein [Rubricoccus marinus]OZC03120.1 hypothetical protein BSZ36_09125 [Rubricoccus marinus]
MSTPIAEVVASSTREIVAETYRDAEPPAFGTWIEVEIASGAIVYALVSHTETGSLEPGRRAMALGAGWDRETIQREMPQLQELIRTTVRAQILGWWDGTSRRPDGRPRVRQSLPPHIAALHDRVRCCAPEAVALLGEPFDALRTLARHPDPAVPADDLIAAVLSGLYKAHGRGDEGDAVLLAAGRALLRLLDDDHERLTSILRRAQDAI